MPLPPITCRRWGGGRRGQIPGPVASLPGLFRSGWSLGLLVPRFPTFVDPAGDRYSLARNLHLQRILRSYFDYAHIRTEFQSQWEAGTELRFWPAYDPDYDAAEPNMNSPEE